MEELLEGCPIEKWKEIVLHASPLPVERELERLLGELARYELERDGQEVSFEAIKKQKQSLAITSMANILSANE
ncbi:hypothetical protein BBW65_01020 [Helicobacter enhydrae]|uniref:DUF2018 family protein n=1 Tax=Helicobacter enhydrae TaxID=222136 RepID=A0A1B1U414_9HELI|nr:DUF2018 family protein [Helicobacter enhydrae]ANV97481.1 hypothetical protein BBW65_01020 [Helicobacter enhydrae]